MFKYILDLFLEYRLQELDQQEIFPVILSIVEYRQYNIAKEPVGLGKRHLKYQPGEIVWVGLEQIEQVLVALKRE